MAKELAEYQVLTKSDNVSNGETKDEVIETLEDLRKHDVDIVTMGHI